MADILGAAAETLHQQGKLPAECLETVSVKWAPKTRYPVNQADANGTKLTRWEETVRKILVDIIHNSQIHARGSRLDSDMTDVVTQAAFALV